MKVFKNRLAQFLILVLAGLAIYTITVKYMDKNDSAGSGLKDGEYAETSDPLLTAKSGESMPTAFRPVFDAICELHESDWLLPQTGEDSPAEDAEYDSAALLDLHYAEILLDAEKIVHSPEFAMLAKEEKPGEEPRIIEGRIEKGDTISSILEKSSSGSVQHYIGAAKKIFSLNSFKEGQPYLVHIDPESGRLQRFEYEINNKSRLVVEGDDKAKAHVEDIAYVVLLEMITSAIGENLFKAVADIGESPQLALRLVKLFGTEINFSRHLDSSDSFSVLIEKRYRDGEYKGYGRIIAAVFTNRGKTYEAFLFRDGSGKETYYNAKGQNLNKTLLQSPLAITRMTSRFTQNRFHPILRQSRPHLGVDYGAPVGTPVKAVGDGVVTERGWAGGYGNQLVIKHSAGLESLYSHLSGFARGMRPGEKVSQGQVIGFVGSTGLSTGSHLDFRLRQNGKFINPAKAINPRGRPVAAPNMEAFKKTRDLAKACLEGKRLFENYSVDSIVPLNVVSVKEDIIVEEEKPRVGSGREKYRRLAKARKTYTSRKARKPHSRRRR